MRDAFREGMPEVGAGTVPACGFTTRARAASANPPDRHYDRSARSFAELWLAGYG